MANKRKGAWTAVQAVLIVAVASFIIAYGLVHWMMGGDPCRSVNTRISASPDGLFDVRKTEVSCRSPQGPTHQVQIAMAERNPDNGKPKKFNNVFVCNNLTFSDVSLAWSNAHDLAVNYPQYRIQPTDINAQQPKFLDVPIQYGDRK